MLRSYTVWLVPVALTLVGFGSGTAPASAQTTYQFSGTYNTTNTSTAIPGASPNINQVVITGSSSDAPYGLTQISGLTYTDTNPTTGEFSLNTDPRVFGLQGQPMGIITLYGSGDDMLFGTDMTTGTIDFNQTPPTATSSGVFPIVGGTGRFSGATGLLHLSEVDQINPPQILGQAFVTGSFETVPEPRPTSATLAVMGMIGAGFLLRRRSLRATSGGQKTFAFKGNNNR